MRNLKTVIEVDFICRYSYVWVCVWNCRVGKFMGITLWEMSNTQPGNATMGFTLLWHQTQE